MFRLSILLSTLVLLTSCAVPPNSPRFQPSSGLPRYDSGQVSIVTCVVVTRGLAIAEQSAAFIGDDRPARR